MVSNSLGGGGGASISWVARAATQIAVSASANPVAPGTPVTLTATVTTTGSVPADYVPTGSVTFVNYDTGLPIGLPMALSAGTASVTTTLPPGTDHVYASYAGDSNFLPSTAARLTEVVTTPVFVKTTGLAAGQAGIAYSATLSADGGSSPYQWSIASGSLPAGVSLDPSTGTIAGKPTAAGISTFKVQAKDSANATAEATLSIMIRPEVQAAVFVVNGGNSAVHSYALGASGNASPLTTLAGASTGLNGTSAVTIAPDGRVYVASANNSSVREFPYGATGNATPTTVLGGPDTGLASPQALVLDGQGRLYVANAAANSVAVYAPGANGDARPIATLRGSHTGLANPSAVTIDGNGNLWVANLSANSLTEYPAAPDGDVAPRATIAGFATRLNGPQGLALDSTGNLVVADTYDNSVTEYQPTANGNVLPIRRIAGSATGLSFPIGVDVDATGNLYVSNQFGGVEEFLYPANGNRTPLATITGSATGLSAPGRLAVAPPLSIRTARLPHAQTGRRYHAELRANLGTTPYAWRLRAGHLPRGFRLSREGRIAGRTHQRGRFGFTVRVTDAGRPVMHADRRLTLVVR
jgi:sugar lactone lactonase YvrE